MDVIKLFQEFLMEQERAKSLLSAQFPSEKIDIYQDRIEDLIANLKVLMYYQISPNQLDSLLKLNKAHRNFDLLNEVGLELEAYGKIAENIQTLLYKQGQLNTFRSNKPVDYCGDPIPWITYPALEFLLQFDYKECVIFEFGAGNSTLFWAKRARNVVSVETDFEWFEVLREQKPFNVELTHIEDAEKFAESIIQSTENFDVIVIDSLKYRYGATLNAVKRLAPGGVVIFDNSDWYPNSCQLLRDAGLCQIDFHGFGPANGYTWTTSLFFKDGIKLKRIASSLHPVGGINVHLDDDEPIYIYRK
ncbi:class I SAM-dependent methyltransferase [Methylomonas sp. MK1]|uniref:class I SAM-dependent methyltransferase n=1 Tax=Methylomonas sp. MK1 TaxID=1131552 RepID=UPI0003628DB5|nr:class I SAM-dependent methyltransferase [Methylomonas sp. MK1]